MKKNFLVATRMKILFVTRISGNKSFIFFLALHFIVLSCRCETYLRET